MNYIIIIYISKLQHKNFDIKKFAILGIQDIRRYMYMQNKAWQSP